MNLKQIPLISIIILLLNTSSIAQTIVPRFINTNQIWTIKGSPYIFTQDLLIDTGAILTIMPGTEIISNNKFYIMIKGGVEARGNSDSFINLKNVNFIFTDKSKGYNFYKNQGSFFNYCNFNDSPAGGWKFKLEETGLSVKNCNFNYSSTCFTQTNYDKDSIKLRIEKCNFNMAHTICSSSGTKDRVEMSECNISYIGVFRLPTFFSMDRSNINLLSHSNQFEINERNKTFIMKCNSFSGIQELFKITSPDSTAEIVIVGNTFGENIEKGFVLSQFPKTIKKFVVKNNNFLAKYRFIDAPNNSSGRDTLIFTKNYWGTVDTAIISKGIIDKMDSKNKYLIDFSRFHLDSVTGCIEDDSVEKTGLPASTKRNKTAEFKFYPNPANQFISILTNSKSIGEYSVLASSGELVKKGILNFGENIIDVSSFKGGIYFIKVTRADSIYGYQKLVISR